MQKHRHRRSNSTNLAKNDQNVTPEHQQQPEILRTTSPKSQILSQQVLNCLESSSNNFQQTQVVCEALDLPPAQRHPKTLEQMEEELHERNQFECQFIRKKLTYQEKESDKKERNHNFRRRKDMNSANGLQCQLLGILVPEMRAEKSKLSIH